ncbi:MAG: 2-amino-4-hydroxy-6-hydroxymethyldihydropteridine diphosphokinase [Burkholderiaceae bacterium]
MIACDSTTYHNAYIGLGANLGNAQQSIRAAMNSLGNDSTTAAWSASSLYRSAPIQAEGPDFINAAMWIRTSLKPLALLHRLQQLEQDHGRQRTVQNAPRTLDLDLILYDTLQMNSPELILPHPRMHKRRFVLAPLLELCAGLCVPGLGKISDLLADVAGQPLTPVCGAKPSTRSGGER